MTSADTIQVLAWAISVISIPLGAGLLWGPGAAILAIGLAGFAWEALRQILK